MTASAPELCRFGAMVRSRRLALGWTLRQLAERCGLHHTFIGCIERAEQSPTVLTVHRLAEGLGISVAELLSTMRPVRSRTVGR